MVLFLKIVEDPNVEDYPERCDEPLSTSRATSVWVEGAALSLTVPACIVLLKSRPPL